jgi:ubiquinone/menaquinone biosynthesis C-methylase UbiE
VATRKPEDSFNQMAPLYDMYRGVDTQVLEYLSRQMKARASGRDQALLDIGCGTGRYSIQLAENYDLQLTGVDVSEKMLNQAREKHPSGVWLLKPIEEAVFSDEPFDFILMSYVIHHLKDYPKTLSDCHRYLRPGGALFIVTDSHEQFHDSYFHQLVPSILEIDLNRFPEIDTLCDTLTRMGFKVNLTELSKRRTVSSRRDVEDIVEKTRRRYVSTLTYLTDDELETGAQRVEEYLLNELRKGPIVEDRVKTVITASKP